MNQKEFIKSIDKDSKIKSNILDESPIPLGYFDSLKFKITSLSGKDNIENYFEHKLYKEDDLVEMLYCEGGCNNGDGVLINE